MYNPVKNVLLRDYCSEGPVLSSCFFDPGHALSGGLDKKVTLFDISTSSAMTLGAHAEPVRVVAPITSRQAMATLVASGSWDRTVCFWDPRAPVCVSKCSVPGKVFAMSVVGSTLVAALSGRKIVVFDLDSKLEGPIQERESSLKYQTRAVQCFPDGKGFAISSIEGRVAIEYFDLDPKVQEQRYAFKCHRTKVGGVDTVYPVNALAFHRPFGTFASGGCDGHVYIWDPVNRKRVAHLHKYPTSIAALTFSDSGRFLAVASSYTFEEGEKDIPQQDQVFIREVQEMEVKPKALK